MKYLIFIIIGFITFSTFAQNRNYTYDNLGRLTQIQYTTGSVVQYSYDANGNRLQHIISSSANSIDLAFSSMSVTPVTIGAGGSVAINAVNTNTGNAVAPSQYIKVWRSTDTIINAGDVLLDSIVVSSVNANGSYNISNWNVTIPNATTAGTYYLILKTDANNIISETNETNNTKRVAISVTTCPTITITETVTNATCGIANGVMSISVTGGVSPYQYSVTNGNAFQTSNVFNSLAASTYTCKVKDANACMSTKLITVNSTGGNVPIPNFTNGINGQTITLTNTSQYATSYTWDFGDGNITTSTNPSHTYASSGIYNICLTANNACGSNLLCVSVNVSTATTVSTDTMKSWEKQYWIKNTASTERFFPRGIGELSDTSIITVGEYFKLSNGTEANYQYPSFSSIIEQCVYISKVDKNGQPLWVKKLSGNGIIGTNSLSGFGKIKINVLSNDYFVFNVPTDYGSTDATFTFDANGTQINNKKYSYTFGGNQWSQNMITKVSTGYMKLSTQVDWANSNGDNILAVQKLDNSFNISWTQSYRLTTGTKKITIANSIIELTSGDYFITGIVGNGNIMNPYNGNDREGFYLKINSSGNHVFHKLINFNGNNGACYSSLQLNSTELLLLSTVKFNSFFNNLPVVSKINLSTGNIVSSLSDTICCNLNNITSCNLISLNSVPAFVSTTNGALRFIELSSTNFIAGQYKNNFYNNLFNSNNYNFATDILKGLKNNLIVSHTRSNTAQDAKQVIVKVDTAMSIDCSKFKTTINLHNITLNSSTVSSPQITNQVQTATSNPSYTVTNITLQDTILCNYHQAAPCNVTASFTKSKPTACLGDIVTFTNTSNNAPVLLWRINGVNSGNTSSIQKTFTAIGTYTIQLIGSNYGACPDTAEYIYNITSAITISSITTNMNCGQNNGSIIINTTGGLNPFTYSINNGGSYSSNNTFTNLVSNTYTLKVVDANGCSATNTAIINTINNPNISIAIASNIPNCSSTCNGTAIVSASGGNSPYTYALTPVGTQSSPGNFSNLCANTIYTITTTDATGCTKASTFNIINSAIILNVTASSTPANGIVCAGTSVTLNGGGASSYSWSGGVVNGLSFIPTTTTTYTVTGSSTNGCTATATKTIIVNTVNVTASSIPASGVVCAGTSLTLNGGGANSYSWSGGITNGIAFIPTTSATYTVTGTTNGCSSTATKTIVVNTLANINLTASSPNYCSPGGTPVNITASSISSLTYTYNPNNTLTPSSGAIVNATPTSTTTYTVTGTSANGCTRTSTLTITVIPCAITNFNIKLFIQGYYISLGQMIPALKNQGVGSSLTITDSITVELHSAASPYSLINSQKVILNTSGIAAITYPSLSNSYYIVIKHRNGLETWSAAPVAGGLGVYNFTTSSSNAFGNNMKLVETNTWALYSGDLNDDENIDLLDVAPVEADINNFTFGYYATDVNGDGNVDLLDAPIVQENVNDFIFSIHP